MPDSVVSGDRCYYCGMAVWQETTSWLGDDDLSYNCRHRWLEDPSPRPHYVRRPQGSVMLTPPSDYSEGQG